ncbi:alpha/beta fold hydrolase [uncultured Nocardioides sp.]|uniref:alpha/beta fold hydrolase n=1 Tax=uncultured Nocardioides sp. TaxID=198441 RepID=UPI0026155D7D|nr:alpha/beta hydrolase [uncultured Nocardioides sp.]
MRLATRRYGAGGRHVALVHGLGADGDLWRGLVERVVAAGGTTVTTVDLRGHGLSDRATDHTLDAFAGDLVDTLPTGLDLVVGHSLGGSVLERAVARLAPAEALYLDPGFRLGLPSAGLTGRLFWATAPVGLTVAALAQRRRSRGRPEPSARDAALRTAATDRFDRAMTLSVLRDVAHHPASVAAPVVPSTLLLSDDAPAVVADKTVTRLAALGWRVRRLPGIGHDLWLEDLGRTWDAVRDVLLGERPAIRS